MRWDEETGRVSVFRKPSNFANGHTRDRQGRLVSCEHDTRRVTRTEYDGTITVLIDKFEGKPLNSPNDIVVKSDESVWFTDPPFGILGNYEGHVATPELPTNVYRARQDRAGDGRRPAISTGRTAWPSRPTNRSSTWSRRRSIRASSRCSTSSMAAPSSPTSGPSSTRSLGGTPDGFRVDIDGNLWCGWGMGNAQQDGVKIFDPAGKPIGFIALPERCANVCFGGAKRNRLFMAASHSVYALYVNTQGVKGG